MKRVSLAGRDYFLVEDGDPPREYSLGLVGVNYTPEAYIVDAAGTLQPFDDAFTIGLLKTIAAEEEPAASGRKNKPASDWKHALNRWLDKERKAGRLPGVPTEDGGKAWEILRSKESVFKDLTVKISLHTFRRQVQPNSFKYKGLPLKWASPGGSSS